MSEPTNVIPFPRSLQPTANGVSDDDLAQFNAMISVLEYSLERVRAGEINGLAVILGELDGSAQYALPVTRMTHLTAFVGAAEQMKLDIVEEIRTRRKSVEE